MILALGLLVVPAAVSAQLEIGLDGGLFYYDQDGAADAAIGFQAPMEGARVGFMAGPNAIIESRLQLSWFKQGDGSFSGIKLVPGLNYMVTPQVYVRGEAGLTYAKSDNGVDPSESATQYLFGGGVGLRRALGAGAVLRLEGGLEMGLENADDLQPKYTDIHATVGVSAVIGG